MKSLIKVVALLFISIYFSGCAGTGFQLGNASPPPMADEGHSWNENLSHSQWVNSTSPSNFLDNAGAGPIWH